VRKVKSVSKDTVNEVQMEANSRGLIQEGGMETRHFRIVGVCFIERISMSSFEIRDRMDLNEMQLLVFH
jgi:hypothetical protein